MDRPSHYLESLTIVALLPLIFFHSPPLYASAIDLLGFGAESIARGMTGSALSPSPLSPYINPAGLGLVRTKTMELGFQWGFEKIPDIGGIVYDVDMDGIIENSDRATVRNNYEDVIGVYVGSLFPFGPRMTLGFSFYLPTERVIRVQTYDPYLPHYLFYKNRSQRYSLIPAMGIKVFDCLSIGLGAQVFSRGDFYILINGSEVVRGAEEELQSEIYVNLSTVELDLALDLEPTAGIFLDLGEAWPLLKGLTIAGVYRNPTYLDINIDVEATMDVKIEDLGDMEDLVLPVYSYLLLTLFDFYTPRQLILAVGYSTPGRLWTGTFELQWNDWSEFIPSLARIMESEFSPPLFGIDNIYNMRESTTEFKDTLVPRFGSELYLGSLKTSSIFEDIAVIWRFGTSFEKSPVSEQTGKTNFLDSDRVVFTTGTGFTFSDPFRITPGLVTLNLFAQWHHMIPRSHLKDPDMVSYTDIGYPISGKIVSKGEFFNFGFGLRFPY